MEKLRREELPKDYRYYRSHSETYFSWIARHAEKHGVRTVFEDGFYGLVAPVFGKWLWTASFEKGDFEPTREVLEKYGFER